MGAKPYADLTKKLLCRIGERHILRGGRCSARRVIVSYDYGFCAVSDGGVEKSARCNSRGVDRSLSDEVYRDDLIRLVERDKIEQFYGASAEEADEVLYLISLDESDDIISIDLIGEGTVNSAEVAPRRLLDIAVRNRAKTVIIAHNHPAGRATPSSEDMAFTDAAEKLLSEIGIRLRAHYIVAGNQCRRID